MKKSFVVATHNIDADNDRIVPGALNMPNKPVLIFDNFDHSKRIGVVNSLTENGNEITVVAEMNGDYFDSYPAIGFNIIKSHMEGDIRVLDEIELKCVSLSTSRNVDYDIKTIGEQTK